MYLDARWHSISTAKKDLFIQQLGGPFDNFALNANSLNPGHY